MDFHDQVKLNQQFDQDEKSDAFAFWKQDRSVHDFDMIEAWCQEEMPQLYQWLIWVHHLMPTECADPEVQSVNRQIADCDWHEASENGDIDATPLLEHCNSTWPKTHQRIVLHIIEQFEKSLTVEQFDAYCTDQKRIDQEPY